MEYRYDFDIDEISWSILGFWQSYEILTEVYVFSISDFTGISSIYHFYGDMTAFPWVPFFERLRFFPQMTSYSNDNCRIETNKFLIELQSTYGLKSSKILKRVIPNKVISLTY